jgi:hypothetical protein
VHDHVSVWFGGVAYRLFGPPVEHYTDILLNRVVPLFDDLDGEQQRVAEETLGSSGWGDEDYERAVEAAYEQSTDHVLQFMEMRTNFLTVGVSGLFHLFEKQLYRHLNRELRDWLTAPINEWRDASDLILKLSNRYGEGEDGLELQRNFLDPDLTEVRLVANAVKHGEGPATEALRKMNAVVVSADRLTRDWTVGEFSILNVAVAIEPADVVRYRDAILRFWATNGTYWAPRAAFK